MVDNKYGIEPEEYADLEENYPQLDKNTSSGQSPKNPFDGGGGGADFFEVNITKTGSGDSATYSADKTITQIVDAYNAGKSIYAVYPLSNTNKKVMPLVRMAIGTSARATFCNVESSAASGTSTVVVVPTVNAITIDKNNVTLYRDFDLLTKEMEVRTIDSESTNYRYPTAKAVYDFVSSSSGGMVVNLVVDQQAQTSSLDKTFNEIKNALDSGANVVVKYNNQEEIGETVSFDRITQYYTSNIEYMVYVDMGGDEYQFITDDADGYPVAD